MAGSKGSCHIRRIAVMTYIHHLLFRLFVYFKGINFFKIDDVLGATLVSCGTFIVSDEKKIQFKFYKKTYEDIIYKRGSISKEHLVGYMVECAFDASFPANLREFNNMKFVLRNNFLFCKLDEDIILHFLIEFYVDYIKHNLPKDDDNSATFA